MEKHNNDNTSAFHASEYDQKIKMTLPYYDEFYKQVVDLVKIHFNHPVEWLDLGCGTGKMAEVAFENTEIAQFVFCDNSEQMLDIARKRFGSKSTMFMNFSVLELDKQDQFDVITAIQVFHYLQRDERVEAMKRCYDALHDNGLFITFENFAPFSEIGTEMFLNRWKAYQIAQGKTAEESEKHIGRYQKGYFPITITKHLDVMKNCGFSNVEIIWVSNMQVGLVGIK